MADTTHDVLIDALCNPLRYPHPVGRVDLIETHISWLLLTGDFVYKIKKPLNPGFLDFSTLEKRHFYCLEELRLNKRLAPEIYLQVVAIRGSQTDPRWNGSGPAVEYAVKMRQFDPQCTFDQLLQRRRLTIEHINQTALLISAFHDRIPRAPDRSDYGSADAVMRQVRDNFAQFPSLPETTLNRQLHALRDWSDQAFSNLRVYLQARRQGGFVRECHGDLHLGNIALIDGRVVPFDGIEFNASLYWIDVISEVAFLVMDLAERQRPDLAFQFLNTYLQQTGDYAGLLLLRFYLVYRAVVRAKVSGMRANQSRDAGKRLQDLSRCARYLRLATECVRSRQPVLLIMHGASGSGKSWLSEQIIRRFECIRIRSDVERKRMFGQLSAHQDREQSSGAGLYSHAMTSRTYRKLLQLARDILGAGYSVVVDATFLRQSQRRPYFDLAAQRRIPLRLIRTVAHEEILVSRIKERAAQQNNVSDASPAVLRQQMQTLQALTVDENSHALTVDTSRPDELDKFWRELGDFFIRSKALVNP